MAFILACAMSLDTGVNSNTYTTRYKCDSWAKSSVYHSAVHIKFYKHYAFHYRTFYNLTTTNTVTRLRAGQSRVQILAEARNLSSPNHADQLCGPPSHLFNKHQASFPWIKWPECDVYHNLHLVLTLRVSGAILLLLLYIFMASTGTTLTFTATQIGAN